MSLVSPGEGLVFQVTHLSNAPWILGYGLMSAVPDPAFVEIGNPDLVERRRRRPVPVPPGGTLGDYVSFHFTPHLPALGHIKIGRHGITRRPISELIIVVSSLPTLAQAKVPFVFTDQHASLATATFFTSLADLPRLEWPLWLERDVELDISDPDRPARYAAEALAYQHVPVHALLGVACYGDEQERALHAMVGRASVACPVWRRPQWFL
jgi:hypothetical protein